MKKFLLKVNMAIVALLVSSPAMAAVNASGLCSLIVQMQDVFKILRVLAFVGAAFVIASWAWGYIKDGKGVDIDDLRKKGTGMLVGFILLFSIGAILTAFSSMSGLSAMGCNMANW